jgi:Zinc carboxypeptidase
MVRWLVRSFPLLLIALLIGVLLLAVPGQAQTPEAVDVTPEPDPFSDRYPAEVVLSSSQDMAVLVRLNIDIASVRTQDGGPYPASGAPFEPLVATVYVNDGEAQLLALEGLTARAVPNESLRAWKLYGPGQPGGWPTYDAWVTRMQTIANAHPTIVRMVSIGTSVQGRTIWLLKITDNPDVEEDEPEFKYTSTLHGIEPVGGEMSLRLADLLTDNYGTDPTYTAIVDSMEIWLCPIHNPDGYVAGSYLNAHGVNLNRDFPDRINDPVNSPVGREPETQAFMNFQYPHRFVMGANYHSGALVVNYPWDAVFYEPEYAPDDAIYTSYSMGYASRNPMILNGGFADGVTRGWEWYYIYGGMQDWAYYWEGEHHVTIELSDSQPPPYNEMDTYWNNNRDAMLWWMQRALRGARGLVTDALTGQPLDATVDVTQIGKVVRTDPDVGDYHRLLLPGTWTLLCHADGYLDQTWTVQVISGTATVQDCALLQPYRVMAGDSDIIGQAGETVTHTFTVTNVGGLSDSYDISLTPGNWPATLMTPSLGPLASLQSGQVDVVVQIPAASATDGLPVTDVLTITVTSHAAPEVSAEAHGTTHALANAAVDLAADQTSRSALAGQAVTYTLVVTNGGSLTDTYTFTATGNLWPTQFTPVQTLPLAPGATAQILVRVDIPAGPPGLADSVTIRATSGLDGQVYAEVSLITLRLWGVYLPLAVRTGG